jgi:hypothetical protein
MLNSTQSLLDILRLATGVSFVLALVALGGAFFFFRRSRREAFWRLRRQAGQSGIRWLSLALVFLMLSAALCILNLTVSLVEPPAPTDLAQAITDTPFMVEPLATLAVTPIVLASPSVAFSASLEVSSTPHDATPAPSLTPSSTPSPTLDLSPFVLRGIDDVISDSGLPIQPSSVFPAGVTRLYFFFDYREIRQGQIWRQALLREGEIIAEQTQAWGQTPSRGVSYFFFGDSRGFAAGTYEIRLTDETGALIYASQVFSLSPN